MIRKLKIITSVILMVLLTVNIALFAMGKMDILFFWAIIIVCAVFAFVVLPRIKN